MGPGFASYGGAKWAGPWASAFEGIRRGEPVEVTLRRMGEQARAE